jgi:hypothetical protein
MIEKGKKYNYDELKELFDKARMETLKNPIDKSRIDDEHKDDIAQMQFGLMLNGMILFHTLEDNLFESEEK